MSGVRRIFGWIMRTAAVAGLLAITVLLVWAFESRNMPDLRIWHTVPLTSEFTANEATPQSTLQDYLDQEERLFRELRVKIYDRLVPTAEMTFNRYRAGGLQDPQQLPRNWNRTFELVPENIQGGALLLHGLTDSPYSLRRIGEIFLGKGFYVLGLRLPGHGTIPGALTGVNWKDWVAASRIAARHVRERIGPDKPFVIAGYSNGGALTIKYSLDALSDPGLPPADRLLLFSPEIGITPFSAICQFPQTSELSALLRPVQMAVDPARVRPLQVQLFSEKCGPAGIRNHGRVKAADRKGTKGRQAGRLSPGAHLSFLGRCHSRDLRDDRPILRATRKQEQRVGHFRCESLRPA